MVSLTKNVLKSFFASTDCCCWNDNISILSFGVYYNVFGVSGLVFGVLGFQFYFRVQVMGSGFGKYTKIGKKQMVIIDIMFSIMTSTAKECCWFEHT